MFLCLTFCLTCIHFCQRILISALVATICLPYVTATVQTTLKLYSKPTSNFRVQNFFDRLSFSTEIFIFFYSDVHRVTCLNFNIFIKSDAPKCDYLKFFSYAHTLCLKGHSYEKAG
jgi:hypothetical protein